jgi:hypothetical protein
MTEISLSEENKRLKRDIGKLYSALDYWKDQALYFQSERDYYRELAKEGNRDL